jgi:isoleucyl-tRNA synthetase
MSDGLRQEESFPQREERILRLWREWNAFERSVDRRQGRPHFTFYDGPPFATGLPHYGHLLAGTIKDVIPRFKTMQGYYVPRRFGWDCHGLPVENEIEKSFDLTGAHTIEQFGIARFNEECRKIVLRYTKEWERTVERMGRWVDFSHPYRTMDPEFMESVWWVFGQLWDKGLVYQGFKVMPFSTKLGTPVSNFEANLNYKEVDDPALTVAFPLVDDPGCSLLIWTTTPWTLPSNLAAVVHPELTYVMVRTEDGKRFIAAEERLSAVFKDQPMEIVAQLKGQDLVGKAYQPPFDFFAGHPNAFRVIAADFVTTGDGTGIVHAAPGFGEEDFYACAQHGISVVCPVDQNGRFTAEVPAFQGLPVKETDKAIARDLKQRGLLFHQATTHHRYPFCWRSDTPLIYKAVHTWFVAVEKIKERLIHANQQIHWVPAYIRDGRFGKWLEGARDWAISRNRYWGTPIPIWRAEDGETLVISSRAQLEQMVGRPVPDLHRHFLDELTLEINGKRFHRVPEVFDCWFESGSMPYAQLHYPFENQELFQETFPADFIAEGLDQTRGWFYTLTVLAAALFDKPAFRNVIVNGIVLAADGQKMSKSLKNYPDPKEVIDKTGADAVRLYLLNSPATQAEDLCFSEPGVEGVLRQVLIPLWNATHFYRTYAEIHEWRGMEQRPELTELDRWLLAATQHLVHQVTENLERYDLPAAIQPCVSFVDQLTNWYIRRSRRRFWDNASSPENRAAYWTLQSVLKTLAQTMAPFVPFLTEAIWQELKSPQDPASVHWTDYPTVQNEWVDEGLLRRMDALRRAVSLGHALRKEHRLKVRQPLSVAVVAAADPGLRAYLHEEAHLLAEELNVKQVEVIADEAKLVRHKVKPNFRILGKRVGALMPKFQAALNDPNLNLELLTTQPLVQGSDYILQQDDVMLEREVQPGRVAATEAGITVALATELTPALIQEGLARELINRINTLRKEQGFAITDRIHLVLSPHPELQQALEHHREMVADDILALSIDFKPHAGSEIDLNGEIVQASLTKVCD